MTQLSEEAKKRLHSNLVKLGDMMGDGLHHEPDGRWIAVEYRKTLRALGMLPKTKRNVSGINKAMERRVKEVQCPKCQGALKQTRSGAKRAKCTKCEALFQLLK